MKRSAALLQEIFANKNVLEIACGTGYWTERIAKTATSVYATDINESVLELAKQKGMPGHVSFGWADIYNLKPEQAFDGLFGGFIWSHILLQDLDDFLHRANSQVSANGTIVFMDNHYVEGSNIPIAETDKDGNTFQLRSLGNGTAHRVLKNFPTKEFLIQKLSDMASNITVINLTYYWILSYKPKANQADKQGCS